MVILNHGEVNNTSKEKSWDQNPGSQTPLPTLDACLDPRQADGCQGRHFPRENHCTQGRKIKYNLVSLPQETWGSMVVRARETGPERKPAGPNLGRKSEFLGRLLYEGCLFSGPILKRQTIFTCFILLLHQPCEYTCQITEHSNFPERRAKRCLKSREQTQVADPTVAGSVCLPGAFCLIYHIHLLGESWLSE